MDNLRRLQQLRDAIQYERAPGIHSFHVCQNCGKHMARLHKCAKCLNRELRAIVREMRTKAKGKPCTVLPGKLRRKPLSGV